MILWSFPYLDKSLIKNLTLGVCIERIESNRIPKWENPTQFTKGQFWNFGLLSLTTSCQPNHGFKNWIGSTSSILNQTLSQFSKNGWFNWELNPFLILWLFQALKPWLKPLKSQLFESNWAVRFVWVDLWTTLMSLNSLGKKEKKEQNTT